MLLVVTTAAYTKTQRFLKPKAGNPPEAQPREP